MNFKRIAIPCCLLLFFFDLYAQQFGGHPSYHKWRQINTDTVRLIFPKGLEATATDIVNTAHQMARRTSFSIGDNVRKINIVLQNETTISNGYVGLGPRRSEFQLTPLQNSFELGSINWPHTLALHEYRHVQQYNNFRKGISKVFYYLFGEQGQELANSTAIPNWFWEGDAVYQETIMSGQGRGRLPFFFNGYRSLWAAGKNYSWMKLRNGSLQDYVPNHYQLGYMLVAYGREKYGEDFWRKVTEDAVRFKGITYPFQQAIKKYSGASYARFRTDAFRYFKLDPDKSPLPDRAALDASRQKHFSANEEFPQWIDTSHLIYVHSSYKAIASFHIRNVNDGSENRIRAFDISLDNYFSYKNGRVVYTSLKPDTRWGWQDYGIIKILILSTGRQESIAGKTKYFSPDIDASGKNIVAVHVGNDGRSELHLLKNKKLLRRWSAQKYFYTYPKFLDSASVVSAVRDTTGRMLLVKVNLETGRHVPLTPAINGVIGFMQVKDDTITFTASRNGHDELFCIAGNKLFQFEPAADNILTGSYHLSILNGKYCWSDYTATGIKIYTADAASANWIPLSQNDFTRNDPPFDSPAFKQTQPVYSNKTFPVTRYRKSFSLFNVHSWRPVITDPEYTFSLISENILNTLHSEIFATYNRNEKSKQLGFVATYGALFPWIRAGANYTMDRQARFSGEPVFWNEWEGNAGFIIPLNLTSGRNYRNLSFGTDIVYNKRYYTGIFKDTFDNRGFAYLNSFLTFTNQIQKARKQVYPRFAQTLFMRYSHAVTVFTGRQFLATADWYFPGLALTHNLVLNTAFHLRDTMQKIRFSNSFPFSRGYIAENFHRMIKAGADYHFPLVYPDWGFGSIVFFQRIRMAAFYDYTNVLDYSNTGNIYRNEYRSVGAELFFDTKWWNQQSVSFGIRYSRLLDNEEQNIGPNQWEIILPVNLQTRN
ncbi:MAG TPA: hypothetical protein VM012_12565 [Flavitalea sp.]|nr:hypothetical protein [Flavitalea sp.]